MEKSLFFISYVTNNLSSLFHSDSNLNFNICCVASPERICWLLNVIKNVFQKQSSGNKFNLLMCTSYMPSVHPKKEFKNTDFSFKNSLGLCFSLDSRQKRLTFLFELCLLIKLGQNIIARHFILLVWAFFPPIAISSCTNLWCLWYCFNRLSYLLCDSSSLVQVLSSCTFCFSFIVVFSISQNPFCLVYSVTIMPSMHVCRHFNMPS